MNLDKASASQTDAPLAPRMDHGAEEGRRSIHRWACKSG